MRPGQLRPGDASIGGQTLTLGGYCFNEAGAASPRRCLVTVGDNNRAQIASMRPGQLRPGDDVIAQVMLIKASDASMRPGQLRPGDSGSRPLIAILGIGFNEAGAASPRRSPDQLAVLRQAAGGFNEAGAASPRR